MVFEKRKCNDELKVHLLVCVFGIDNSDGNWLFRPQKGISIFWRVMICDNNLFKLFIIQNEV